VSIALRSDEPLMLLVDEDTAAGIDNIDAGTAYTAYLHDQVGEFAEEPLGAHFDLVSETITPRGRRYSDQTFQYADLREVDDVFGQVLSLRELRGSEIGSAKKRFRQGDILFARIMPSLANKKVALVTQDVANAVASTEFLVLRQKPDSTANLHYLFRALRSDHFTRQAEANVTGATGRQRIAPDTLRDLKLIVAPPALQQQVGDAVEEEFRLRALAAAEAQRADDQALPVLGPTTLRTQRVSTRTLR
jgi:type I restriction enzyme S subunit